MFALQLNQPLSFRRIKVPAPNLELAPGRLLIQTKAVSICGSDIAFFIGAKSTSTFPLPPGAPVHECVGLVIKSSAALFQPGDLVVAIPDDNRGLAEFFTAREERAVKLPANPGALDSCCLIQPLSTVMNAVDRLEDVSGLSVAVVGLGSIGQLFCWLLKKRGARRIVGIDPIAQRCQAAIGFGASETICLTSHELIHANRRSPERWEPPDIVIEAVGHQMDSLNDCLELVRKQGTVVAFGVPDHPVYALEFETFFRKNLNLVAAVTPRWGEYLEKGRDLYFENRNELEKLITHRMPILAGGAAFLLYAQRADGILKVVMDAANWGKE